MPFEGFHINLHFPIAVLYLHSGTQIEYYFPVSVPLTPLSTFMGRWVFGEALCKLLPASQVIRDVGNHHCNRKS